MFAKKKRGFSQSLGDPAPLTAICHLRPLPVSVLKLHRVALGWRLAASVRVLVWENRTVSSANSRPLALMPSPKSLTSIKNNDGAEDFYGVRGTALPLIENFLSGRTQQVVAEGESSSVEPDISPEYHRDPSSAPTLFLVLRQRLGRRHQGQRTTVRRRHHPVLPHQHPR